MVFYPTFGCVSSHGLLGPPVAQVFLVSTWFLEKRGAALGLAVAGSSLGGVIFPIMVVHLIPEVGVGWAMRICAFLILVMLVFADFTLRS